MKLEHSILEREPLENNDENIPDYLFIETFSAAPQALKAKLYSHTTPRLAGDNLIHLARVRFGRHHCELDTAGRWSIVVPTERDGSLEDFAAIAVDDIGVRQTNAGAEFAVNLEGAMFDARLHPYGRLRTHWCPWEWMRDDCSGALVLNWHRMSAFIKTWRVSGLEVTNVNQAREVHIRMSRALRVPEIHVVEGPI
jgi:hypothetical protein